MLIFFFSRLLDVTLKRESSFFHGFKPLKPLKLWSGQIETFSLKYTMRLL